tara:strand:+ start:17804 stop:23419 length:5616 start_codon:yes stop_codon:yes gene_type:complete
MSGFKTLKQRVHPQIRSKLVPREDLKKTDMVVMRSKKNANILSVTLPNRVQIGLDDKDFLSDLLVTGDITGSIVYALSGFTGSLTKLTDGTDYLRAGSNIGLTYNDDGSIKISATGFSNSALTAGNGIDFTSGTTFDGSAAQTISLDLKSGGGLKSSTGELEIDITGTSTSAGIATNDEILIYDTSASALKKVTVSDVRGAGGIDIASISSDLSSLDKSDILAIADISDSNTVKKITLNNLSAWQTSLSNSSNYGIQSYNGHLYLKPSDLGTAAAINPADDTIIIDDASDGSSLAKKIGLSNVVDAIRGTPSSTGISSTSGVLNVDINSLSTTTLDANNDYVMVYDASATGLKKASITDLSVGSAPANAQYLVLASNSQLTNESVLTGGDGISLSSATLSLDLKSNSGLTIDSGKLKIDYGSSTGQAAQGSNQVTITAGDGLSGGGTFSLGSATSSVTLDINPEDIAGTGIESFNNNLRINVDSLPVDSNSGHLADSIAISDASDSNLTKKITLTQLKALVNTEGTYSPGDGLDLTGSTFSLDLKASGGLKIDSTELTVDDSIIPHLSGATFTGNITVPGASGIKGSIQKLSDGSTNFLQAGSNMTVTNNADGSITLAASTSGEAFKTVSVSGQADVVADSTSDTLNFVAGDNISITTNASSDSITISGNVNANIGTPSDSSWADGLFSGWTSGTSISNALDAINEVLLQFAPGTAPPLDNIDCDTSPGITGLLSFGAGNDQSSSGNPYISHSTTAGFSPAANVNSSYAPTTSGNNIRKGIYNGTQVISGDLNEDVIKNQHNTGVTNYVANSFGSAEQGTLKLYVNGALKHSVDLTQASTGQNAPGSTGKDHFNSNNSGFILSQKADGTQPDGSAFAPFQHRTGKYQIGTSDQRNGWNYARVVHSISGQPDIETNYIEWVNDSNAEAIAATSNQITDITLTGNVAISGIRYATDATANYKVNVENAYKYIYNNDDITFTTTNCSISSISPKPSLSSGETHTKIININRAMDINLSGQFGGTCSAAVNVTHPFESKNLSNGGSTSATGFLIYNVTNNSTDQYESFRMENKRLVSASYGAQGDIASNGWNNNLHLSGSANQADGLIFYNDKLFSAINTLNSGDFRNTTDGGSLANAYSGNPNYSSLNSGTKTFFRAFKNESSNPVRDFHLAITANGTSLVNLDSAMGNTNIKIAARIPGSTDWMDLAKPFIYNSSSYGSGGYIGSLSSNFSATNHFSFGTTTVAHNDSVVIAVEAPAGWTGFLEDMTVTFPAVGVTAVSHAPKVERIDCNDTNGKEGRLSFGASKTITGYEKHDTTAGFSPVVDINGTFGTATSANNLRMAIFKGNVTIDGEVNSHESGSGNNFPALAFRQGNEGVLKLYVNGSLLATADLDDLVILGISKTESLCSNNRTGFHNITRALNGKDGDNLPDFRYWYRTASYKIHPDDQRNGWNYARVVHSISGQADRETNYIEWINDTLGQTNDISTSSPTFSTFSSAETYYQSGVKYFSANPTGTLAFAVDNCYENVCSSKTNAISITNDSNFNITRVDAQGSGVVNSFNNASSMSLPLLDTTVANPQNQTLNVIASLTFNKPSSLPNSTIAGGTAHNAAVSATIKHPLKSNGTLSSQTKNSFLVYSGSDSSNINTTENFVQETQRLQSGSYGNQASVISGNGWNSQITMNSTSYAPYSTGLLIYNGKLISPKKGPFNGDFRDTSENSGATNMTSPLSNVNYTNLGGRSTRHYIRRFKNNTTTDTPRVTITIAGDATLVGQTGSYAGTIGANKNIHLLAKIPGKTGWMDVAKDSEGDGNITDGDGGLYGSLDAAIDPSGASNICTFNGQTVNGTASSPEYFIISIIAHENWTGYISGITVAYS